MLWPHDFGGAGGVRAKAAAMQCQDLAWRLLLENVLRAGIGSLLNHKRDRLASGKSGVCYLNFNCRPRGCLYFDDTTARSQVRVAPATAKTGKINLSPMRPVSVERILPLSRYDRFVIENKILKFASKDLTAKRF